jgi:chromosome segregation ATPase
MIDHLREDRDNVKDALHFLRMEADALDVRLKSVRDRLHKMERQINNLDTADQFTEAIETIELELRNNCIKGAILLSDDLGLDGLMSKIADEESWETLGEQNADRAWHRGRV